VVWSCKTNVYVDWDKENKVIDTNQSVYIVVILIKAYHNFQFDFSNVNSTIFILIHVDPYAQS